MEGLVWAKKIFRKFAIAACKCEIYFEQRHNNFYIYGEMVFDMDYFLTFNIFLSADLFVYRSIFLQMLLLTFKSFSILGFFHCWTSILAFGVARNKNIDSFALTQIQ